MSKYGIPVNRGGSLDNSRLAVIESHFIDLSAQYPGLTLTKNDDGTCIVYGELKFNATYEGKTISDKFQIELAIPKEYPNNLPIVKETSGRIPKEFHTYKDGGSLCLGAPLDVRMKFKKKPSLLGFVEELVIHYLYSFCYWEQHGKMPFGEFSHGGKGIIEFYIELFNVTSDIITLELLKILAENNYRGHHYCPCNSGNTVRHCHGELLRKIRGYQSHDEFLYDYVHCLTYIQKSGQKLPNSLLSKKLMNRIKKYSHVLDKNEKRSINTVEREEKNKNKLCYV